MKKIFSFATLVAIMTLLGCASTGSNGEKLPENPLANGYALISLCGPNDKERSGGHWDYECGKGLTLRRIDNESEPRLLKRDQVYVLPGRHQVRIAGARGYIKDFDFNAVAGKIYHLTTGGLFTYSNDPELVRHFEKDLNIKYSSGYYKE
jgi:hypothetical protein